MIPTKGCKHVLTTRISTIGGLHPQLTQITSTPHVPEYLGSDGLILMPPYFVLNQWMFIFLGLSLGLNHEDQSYHRVTSVACSGGIWQLTVRLSAIWTHMSEVYGG